MNRGIWGLLLLAAIMTTNADASKWQPYVQGGFIANQATPFWSFKSFKSSEWLPVPISPGGEIEIGMSSEKYDFYIGYQSVNSYQTSDKRIEDYPLLYEEDQWKERRCLLGCRYHWNTSNKQSVIPAIGGALSLGRSSWDHYHEENIAGWMGDITHFRDRSNRQSKIGLGVMGEGAIVFFANKPLSLLARAQVQWYERRFADDSVNATSENLSVLTTDYTLSLRYTLPRTFGK